MNYFIKIIKIVSFSFFVISLILSLDLDGPLKDHDPPTHHPPPVPDGHKGEAQEETQGSSKLCHLGIQGLHQESHELCHQGGPGVD